MRTTIALLALLLISGCEAALQPGRQEPEVTVGEGEVAFDFAGANDVAMIVPVTINGRERVDFVLDTGATLTCVSPELAERLSLPQKRGVRGIGATLGGAGEVGLVEIESLAIGNTKLSGLAACTIDLAPMKSIGVDVDGLLGLNALKLFRVTIDFDRRLLRLEKQARSTGS